MCKLLHTLVVSVFFLNQIIAQYQNFSFTHLGVDEGLSNNSINCIVQDKQGYMWFGTENGLNRYDGYRFTIYKWDDSNKSVNNNIIRALYEDHLGNLWIGTECGGINKFNPVTETFEFYINHPDNNNSLSNNSIRAIYEDNKGLIWIGTSGGGLNIFNPEKKFFKIYKHQPGKANSLIYDYVYSIIKDSKGNIWIGTENGLSRTDSLKISNGEFVNYIHDANNKCSIVDNRILTIFEDANKDIWFGTWNGGMSKYSINNGKECFINYKSSQNKSLNNDIIWAIANDFKNNILIGTQGGGLNYYNKNTGEFKYFFNDIFDNRSLSDNYILSIYACKSGIIWIGTRNGGVNKFDQNAKRFEHYTNFHDGIENNERRRITSSLYQDKEGNIWIGTYEGGLDIFDKNKGVLKNFKFNHLKINGLPNNTINHIIQDKTGNIWLATDGGGICKFNPKSETFETYKKIKGNPNSLSHDYVHFLLIDSLDRLWIGTWGGIWGGGLDVMDLKTKRFKNFCNDVENPYSLSSNIVMCLFIDSKFNLWVGTRGGGINMVKLSDFNFTNPAQTRFKRYMQDLNANVSISSNYIYTIFEDSQGIIWIGTGGGGLIFFDPEKDVFVQIVNKDTPYNDVIYGILEDKSNNLWFSTNDGLFRYDQQKNFFKKYAGNDGPQSNTYTLNTYYKNQHGEMLFGGLNGITIFNPDSIKDNPILPAIIFSDFQINNKSVSIGYNDNNRILLPKSPNLMEKIDLDYDDKVISIEFAAIHYSMPEKNKYAYMLEGFDKDWTYTSSNKRYATYTNLNPGKYIFKVKASNNDGLWNDKGIKLIIRIHPPFWKTIWFKILIFILILVSVFAFNKLRVRVLEVQKKNLEETVKLRTKEVLDQKNELEHKNTELEQQKEEISTIAEQLDIMNKELEKLVIVARETDNAVLIIDGIGNIEWVNHGFINLLGFDLKQFKEHVKYNILASDKFEYLSSAIKECYNSQKTIIVDFEMLNANMQAIFVTSTITPILNEKGEIKKLIAILSDITDLKKAELEIVSQKEELQKVNATKDKLFSIVAHDLVNPLYSITNLSGYLYSNFVSISEDEKIELSELINKSLLNLQYLVENLLSWSRSQMKRFISSPQNIIIMDLINKSINLFLNDANRKGIFLNSEITEGLIVFADKSMIDIVIRNLMSNAIKFTSKGGTINISGKITDKFAEVSISDTGIGIKEENLEKIFKSDLFFTTAGTDHETGTGLGLKICKEYVEQNNGQISVESKAGFGATFRILLPLGKY